MKFIPFACLVLAAGLPGQITEIHQPHDPFTTTSKPWWEWDRATGAWGGLRQDLEDRGFDLHGALIYDSSQVLAGGSSRRPALRGLLDLSLALDTSKLIGFEGGQLFVDGYSVFGRDGTKDTGDIQGYSNIDAAQDFTVLAELWYEQQLLEGVLRFKVGKVDANTEFALVESAIDYIHSSAGFSPTIFVFPTYPNPATSVNVSFEPASDLRLAAGVYNAGRSGAVSGRRGLTAEFDEAFLIGELGLSWSDDLPGRFALGAWHHTGELPRFDGGSSSGTEGLYLVAEHTVYREDRDAAAPPQGLTLFAQYGVADGDLTDFEQHVGFGATWTGLVPRRDEDRTGVLVSHVDLSDAAAADFADDETAFGVFHMFQATPSLALLPDFQYIVHPSGRRDIDDTFVATLRVVVSF